MAKAPWLQRAGLNSAPVTSSRVGHPGGFSCLPSQITPRPVLKPQLGKTLAQQGGEAVGTEQGSQPDGSAVALCSLGQVTWLLQRCSSSLPRRFFTFRERCKTVVVLFREMPAVLSRLSGFFYLKFQCQSQVVMSKCVCI